MNRRFVQGCVRWGRWLPAAFLFQQIGCLPDQAIQQVFAENIVLTAAVTIQSITSLIFNSIFGLV